MRGVGVGELIRGLVGAWWEAGVRFSVAVGVALGATSRGSCGGSAGLGAAQTARPGGGGSLAKCSGAAARVNNAAGSPKTRGEIRRLSQIANSSSPVGARGDLFA
jgi:hypothetical protein